MCFGELELCPTGLSEVLQWNVTMLLCRQLAQLHATLGPSIAHLVPVDHLEPLRLSCRPLAHLINFKYVPSDWRILFNNVVAIGWTTYLSFTCGPASGGATGTADGAAAAAAASALLSAIPCSKVPGALHNPGLMDAAQQVAAFQQMLAAWGTKVGK